MAEGETEAMTGPGDPTATRDAEMRMADTREATEAMKSQRKKKRGRPPVLVMPAPIPDTPENVTRAILSGSPKRDWDFLKPGSGAKIERND